MVIRGLHKQAAAWCALNGVGLALVMPCVQSIIAEVYRSKSRGKAFGIIFTTSAFGEPCRRAFRAALLHIALNVQQLADIVHCRLWTCA